MERKQKVERKPRKTRAPKGKRKAARKEKASEKAMRLAEKSKGKAREKAEQLKEPMQCKYCDGAVEDEITGAPEGTYPSKDVCFGCQTVKAHLPKFLSLPIGQKHARVQLAIATKVFKSSEAYVEELLKAQREVGHMKGQIKAKNIRLQELEKLCSESRHYRKQVRQKVGELQGFVANNKR